MKATVSEPPPFLLYYNIVPPVIFYLFFAKGLGVCLTDLSQAKENGEQRT